MQSNTVAAENQQVNFANSSVENRKADPFTIDGGRYVGHDGFIVPKDFNEFHERFPQYVRNWVGRHADTKAPKEDLEDWTQDLLIHLNFLPFTSKHRAAGKTDIVQTFDPVKHFGANQPRFLNYINLCLANRFRTMRAKRMKNPLCRPGNLSLCVQMDVETCGQADDEYCHSRSEHFRKTLARLEKQRQDRQLISKFSEFVRRENSGVLRAFEAIAETSTQAEAAHFLGLPSGELGRVRARLRKLGQCFLNGEPVPRLRKPYRTRRASCAKT